MLNDQIEINGRRVHNRVVIQPMEGSDCNLDGSPSELTSLKYTNYARSGAGIVWFEASAVCPRAHKLKANAHHGRKCREIPCTFALPAGNISARKRVRAAVYITAHAFGQAEPRADDGVP